MPSDPPSALLRGLWIDALDDLREGHPNLLTSLPTASQPLRKLLVSPLRFPSLACGLVWLGVAAIARRFITMAVQCITAREKITAVIAERDLQRMRLRGIAVALEALPGHEPRAKAEPASNFLDSAAFPVGCRGRQ